MGVLHLPEVVLLAAIVWLLYRRLPSCGAPASTPVAPPSVSLPTPAFSRPQVSSDTQRHFLCDPAGHEEAEVSWHDRELPPTFTWNLTLYTLHGPHAEGWGYRR